MRSLEPSEFLPLLLADARELYDYWLGKRSSRAMPSRDGIDPAEIVHLLPGVMIVDVVDEPRRFVYRLVGTREVEARGQDPTGRSVTDGFFGTSAQRVLENYQLVCDRRAPLFDDYRFRSPNGRYADEQVLFLPLSADDSTVMQILVYTHHRRLQ